MTLKHGIHLAYCTNVHPGESWVEVLAALNAHTLVVREQVCMPNEPYAIGLRLSDFASRELSDPAAQLEFQRWLDQHHCYVFTINGFPFGRFHGRPVKERVFQPDWQTPERVEYTNRLFDLLAQFAPRGAEASVSTLPGSFQEFVSTESERKTIRDNLWKCVEHVAALSERTGRDLHLGLEPEPLGIFENTEGTLRFFEELETEHPNDPRLRQHLGVNYDTCHFALQYEEPYAALHAFRANGIRISKIHLSAALRTTATVENRRSLAAFAEPTYLHQVIARNGASEITRFRDLDQALSSAIHEHDEWRVHFHVPLHCPDGGALVPTTDHTCGVLDFLHEHPETCRHLEMETYTWDVLPPELKSATVEQQLVREYGWCLDQLRLRNLVA